MPLTPGAGTQLLVSEDEYVDEELLLDGTWGNFDGVPDPDRLVGAGLN